MQVDNTHLQNNVRGNFHWNKLEKKDKIITFNKTDWTHEQGNMFEYQQESSRDEDLSEENRNWKLFQSNILQSGETHNIEDITHRKTLEDNPDI